MIRLINVVKQSLINPKIVHNAQEFKKDPLIKYVCVPHHLVSNRRIEIYQIRIYAPQSTQ